MKKNRRRPSFDSSHVVDRALPLIYPRELPITEKREAVVRAIEEHQVIVVTGETGSGKSTQIPKMCLEAGRGVTGAIGCTQPRRIAAITLSDRVAEELGEIGPKLVGHKIRFRDRTSRTTRIKFMTDGILLAEAQKDRLFKAYDTLIVDEAHERTLNIDFLLGLLKKVLPRRPDLKLIVTSATIDPEKFSRAFGNAPIVEVSGRAYPVEVRYRPVETTDEAEGPGGETTYVDRAVAAVDELKSVKEGRRRGDILIFMPTESDIRETVQRLEEKRYFNTLVLPLFGRMAAEDQRRIFRETAEEKIVVSTNVAETSVTIPGIKYVVDTGLARISRYNVRSRTQTLPVSPVSRASADQRKGRCGRVEAGICIRLYSEDDYLNRIQFTPPEIQRSNLAEVILRMLFLRLGSVQEFPFLDPPAPAAIKDGFAVLKELGAVDDHRRLTPTGRTMAGLPLDPRIARMLLQADVEGSLREVAVLAAALSIQDPRERPLEREAEADQAHAVFKDPRSDFVGLLKIWTSYSPGGETGFEARSNGATAEAGEGKNGDGVPAVSALRPVQRSQSALRRLCRERFLSFRRMREWEDVHREILGILNELGCFKENVLPAGYDSIHRAIVSGYLSHVAIRKEKNIYLAAGNRQVMLFPGSGVFNKGGAWIVAAEMAQTTRLFARTTANIEPEWLEALGGHLCRSSYSEPHWERKQGRVVAFEKVTLYGLTIVDRRKVDYARIKPEEARRIFIRSALVEGDLPSAYGFMEHNAELIRRIEEFESKARRRDLLVDEQTLFDFYEGRLSDVADLRTFNKLLKDRGGDEFLRMTEADLLRSEPDFEALEQFPDSLPVGDAQLPLRYAFHPGEDDDGVTVTVPVHLLPALPPHLFDWLVPGMLPEKVTLLLKALPKSVRRQFVPVAETARRLLDCLPFRSGSLGSQLGRCALEMLGVRISPEQWDELELPPHLKMRFEIVGPDGASLGSGRDLGELGTLCVAQHEDRLWSAARDRWERTGLTEWTFGDLPERIEIGSDALGLTRYAWPGLAAEGESVSLRLFPDPEEAERTGPAGLRALYENVFSQELKGLRKDWIFPPKYGSIMFFMGSRKEADAALQDYVLRELFDLRESGRTDRAEFESTVERLQGGIGAAAREIIDEVLEVLDERSSASSSLSKYRRMGAKNRAVIERLDLLSGELDRLTPTDFLTRNRRDFVRELPRYLKAFRIRLERAYTAPEKDRMKAERVKPYEESYERMRIEAVGSRFRSASTFPDRFRIMLEEFKISLFAPEIKTRFRISTKRLDEEITQWPSWKESSV